MKSNRVGTGNTSKEKNQKTQLQIKNSDAHHNAVANAAHSPRSTNIVTAFVQDAKSGKILILKRSSKVKSMRELWSGVSGIIEGNEKPLSRAKTEIYEETGITQNKIKLVRQVDAAIHINSPQYKNHEWIVFAFLFEAKRPRVVLNWENSQYRWIDVKDMKKYETVPDLEKVLLCLL